MFLYLCLVSVLTHCCDILSQTICYYLFISYLLLYLFLYLYTLFTYVWIFNICQYEYFAIHIFFARFFSKFYLPDVVSAVFLLFTVMSLAVSICVILVDDDELFTVMSLVASISVILLDDDETNNVKFVLIHMCDKWLWNIASILYHIAYFALFLKSYIFIICIHMYSYIFMCWRCILWQGYWVSYILHAMGVVLWLSTSVYQLGLSIDIPHVSATFTGISVTSSVTFLVSPCCSQPEMLYVKVFLYWMYIFYIFI